MPTHGAKCILDVGVISIVLRYCCLSRYFTLFYLFSLCFFLRGFSGCTCRVLLISLLLDVLDVLNDEARTLHRLFTEWSRLCGLIEAVEEAVEYLSSHDVELAADFLKFSLTLFLLFSPLSLGTVLLLGFFSVLLHRVLRGQAQSSGCRQLRFFKISLSLLVKKLFNAIEE